MCEAEQMWFDFRLQSNSSWA